MAIIEQAKATSGKFVLLCPLGTSAPKEEDPELKTTPHLEVNLLREVIILLGKYSRFIN